jgi:hypothetical protein
MTKTLMTEIQECVTWGVVVKRRWDGFHSRVHTDRRVWVPTATVPSGGGTRGYV